MIKEESINKPPMPWLKNLRKVAQEIKGTRRRTPEEGISETALLMAMAYSRLEEGLDKRGAKLTGLRKRIYLLQFRLFYQRVPVDILIPRDPHDNKVLERRRRKKIKGRFLWIPSAEDFILQKIKVGRPRDLLLTWLVSRKINRLML